jgi:hypothetical protein
VALVLLAAIFYRASVTPVWPIDTWAHWKYGGWIWEHHHLPDREPFSVYSERARLLDTGWLSQVLCDRVYVLGGLEGILLFYGLLEVVKSALYLAAFRRACGSLLLAVLGVALLHAGRWRTFQIFRPQAIGEVCWAALLLVCARPPWPRWGLVVAPLALALWANLQGTFPLGLVLIGLFLACRFATVFRQRRGLTAAVEDPEVRRIVLTLALAAGATCFNPYGPRLLSDAVRFGQTESLRLVGEWLPRVPLADYGARALAASLLAVLVTVRWSPKPFTLTEAALLVLFALAAWFAARMLVWWMTVWPLVLLPHWRAILARAGLERWVTVSTSSGPRGSWLPAAGAVAAVLLVLASPSARWLFGQEARPPEELVRPETPLAVARDLRAPLPGTSAAERAPLRVFCSPIWSDYLLWKLPPGDQLFWYTHWHCYSARRMTDGNRFRQLHGPPNDWQTILARYRFNVVALLNEDDSRPLFEYLLAQRGQPGSAWEVTVYDSNTASGTDEAASGPPRPGEPWGLVARRRVDPFVLALANAEVVQSGVSGGLTPGPSNWAILTNLPWYSTER